MGSIKTYEDFLRDNGLKAVTIKGINYKTEIATIQFKTGTPAIKVNLRVLNMTIYQKYVTNAKYLQEYFRVYLKKTDDDFDNFLRVNNTKCMTIEKISKDIVWIDEDRGVRYKVTDFLKRNNVYTTNPSMLKPYFDKYIVHIDKPLTQTTNPIDKDAMFFKELRETYSVEDFTGYLGVLFDSDADKQDVKDAKKFLEKIYLLAQNYL